jgi:hypothetical protein
MDGREGIMTSTREMAVAALLREAESAHGAYETTVLGGVYDADWPRWYASYLLDHDVATHLPGDWSQDGERLAALLRRLAADYDRGETHEPWSEVYARRLVDFSH